MFASWGKEKEDVVSDQSDWESDSDSESQESDSDSANTPATAGPTEPVTNGGTRIRGNDGPLSMAREHSSTAQSAAVDFNSEDIWSEITGKNDDQPGKSFPFLPSRPSGVQNGVKTDTEINSFQEMFTDEIIEYLCRMINEYGAVKCQMNVPVVKYKLYRNWSPVTASEICKFLAITISMGLNQRSSISEYWSRHPMYESPFYRNVMQRDRFVILYHTVLHISEPDSVGKSNIEPYLQQLVMQFQKSFYPYSQLSIDEMFVGSKRKFKYKQCDGSKPNKHHIQIHGLCDSVTGYVYAIQPYFGGQTACINSNGNNPDLGSSEEIFDSLLEGLGEGHHIFADQFYTTRKLVQDMNAKNMLYTGTLNISRDGFPTDGYKKQLKLKLRERQDFRSATDDLLLTVWRDKKAKKPVVIVSTHAVNTDTIVVRRRQTVTVPTILHDYNRSMSRCDNLEQMTSYYGHFKWYKKLFCWSLEVAQMNSYIIHKLGNDLPTLTYKEYKQKLVMSLLEKAATSGDVGPPRKFSTGSCRQPTNPIERLEQNKHLIDHVNKDRNCRVCSTAAKRRRTNFVCTGCSDQPYLHPTECFRKYHSRMDYKTQ